MNREIEFRGKDMHNDGVWVYGSLLVFDAEVGSPPTYQIISRDKDCYDVSPDGIGQFSGLYDNSVNKIYEGDILLITKHGYVKNHCLVCFEEGCFVIKTHMKTKIDLCAWNTNNIKVVGNIHDNPNLLSTKNKSIK